MDELSDRYAAALRDLAENKAKKGKDIVDPRGEPEEEEEGGAQVIDLMKLLKQRVGATGKATPKPAARADGSSGDLAKLSKEELYDCAQALGVPGRSKMGKSKLIEALQKAG